MWACGSSGACFVVCLPHSVRGLWCRRPRRCAPLLLAIAAQPWTGECGAAALVWRPTKRKPRTNGALRPRLLPIDAAGLRNVVVLTVACRLTARATMPPICQVPRRWLDA
jgi:hypothetical protein